MFIPTYWEKGTNMERIVIILLIALLIFIFSCGAFDKGVRHAKKAMTAECLSNKHFRTNELKFECALTVDAIGG